MTLSFKYLCYKNSIVNRILQRALRPQSKIIQTKPRELGLDLKQKYLSCSSFNNLSASCSDGGLTHESLVFCFFLLYLQRNSSI